MKELMASTTEMLGKQITVQNEGVSAFKEMIASDDDSNKTPVACHHQQQIS